LRRDGLVYPAVGADVHEQWFLVERDPPYALPGLERIGHAVQETAGVRVSDIPHLDLYSCFPVAPRLVAQSLGLRPDTERPLTVTGGLPWFGGPGNNYATHAIAAMVERLRAAPATTALVHALGWNLTKHALAVFSAAPPEAGWRRTGQDVQAWVDARPRPSLAPEPSGPATVEAYTIVHDRDGAPDHGVVLGRLDDRTRFVARLPKDADLLAALEREEAVGRRGTVRPGAAGNLFTPASS
jgi:acetyl-CoA C-acetyltransferase